MQSKELYQKYSSGRHWEDHPTIYAKTFIDFLKNKNFKGKIVDLGCGSGRDVNVFAKANFDALGIDNLFKEIEQCKEKYSELKFELQNIEKLEFDDETIDAFYMVNVIHYVDQEKAFKEIYRTLKSSGYLFIHFNLLIIDKDGNVDFEKKEEHIMKLIKKFKILQKNILNREDREPIPHEHKILELILQKK